MKRKSELFLHDWFNRFGRKPLIIRGARQVGKSTVVRQFAESISVPLFEINLEKYAHLDSVFARFSIPEIISEIEIAIGAEIKPGTKGILFLDEIQVTPNAIAALRYFYEDRKDLAVIAAGSLLEFAMAKKKFSMPVGRVEYLFMGPMSFEEFLEALGETQLLKIMEQFTPSHIFPTTAHERLLMLLRDYLLIGGMPEVVATYVESRSLLHSPKVHQNILNTYRDDFQKYASGEVLTKLQRVMEYSAATVGNKVKYVNINALWKAVDVRSVIDLLSRAGIVYQVHHSNAAGVPLGANADDSVFKNLFLDVGIMNASCGVSALSIDTFKERRFINEGSMAEQFIGQHLLYSGPEYVKPALFYWLREGKKGNAEIDYLMQYNDLIIPIEVKSGTSGSLKSLHQFVAIKNAHVALRFDCNMPSLQTVEHAVVAPSGKNVNLKYQLCSLPLYMVEQTKRIVSEVSLP